jgi:hypothetical protein
VDGFSPAAMFKVGTEFVNNKKKRILLKDWPL